MGQVAFDTAGYIRLSREDGDKEESDSVGNQKKLLTEYISKHDDLVLRDFYIERLCGKLIRKQNKIGLIRGEN